MVRQSGDTNGTLKTAATFDYEYFGGSYTITVQAKDELNANRGQFYGDPREGTW